MTQQITYQKALEIMKVEKSQLFSVNRLEHLALHPKYMGDLKSGVVTLLDSYMSLYHDRFDGVPLAYNNIKMIQNVATMIAYQPYLHFDVAADFIVFKPDIGSSLKGVIQKVEENHISCLVHGTFNAWCPKQPLVKAVKNSDPLALIGCEIEFTVNKVSSNNGVMSLKGAFEKILKRPPPPENTDDMGTPENSKQTFDDNDEEGGGAQEIVNTPGMDQSFCPELSSTQIETPYVPSVKSRKRKLSKVFEGDSSANRSDTQGTLEDASDSYTQLKKKRKKHKHEKEEAGKETEHVEIKLADEKTVVSEEVVGKKHKKKKKKLKEKQSEEVNDEQKEEENAKDKKKKDTSKHKENNIVQKEIGECKDNDVETAVKVKSKKHGKKHEQSGEGVNGIGGIDSHDDFVDASPKKHKKKKKNKKQE